MNDYKVVFRADAKNAENRTTWEHGCPLMFEAIQVSRNIETSEAFLQTKVRNLTDKIIESFKMELSCTYQDGSSETLEVESLDADIPPCDEYVPKPVRLAKGNVAKAEGHITVTKDSQTVWRSVTSPEPLPQRKPLNLSEKAFDERMLQLRERGCSKAQEAAPYEQTKHDGWTQCACGQISIGLRFCPSCGLDMEEDAGIENEEVLTEAALNRERKAMEAREERARINASLEKKVKKWLVVSCTVVVLVVALFFLYLNVVKPSMLYSKASASLESGDYDVAISTFTELEGYKDSSEKITEAREGKYNKASALLESGDYDAAAVLFSELGDYRDSKERIGEAEDLKNDAALLVEARYAVEHGEYEEARESLAQMSRPTQESNSLNDLACNAIVEERFDSGDIKGAYDILQNYENYSEKVVEYKEQCDPYVEGYRNLLGKYSDNKKYPSTGKIYSFDIGYDSEPYLYASFRYDSVSSDVFHYRLSENREDTLVFIPDGSGWPLVEIKQINGTEIAVAVPSLPNSEFVTYYHCEEW